MKQNTSIFIIVAMLAITSTGCSTIGTRMDHQPKGPYPAVRAWPAVSKEALSAPQDIGQVFSRFGPVALPFVIVDLPLAVAFDTAFLPADLVTAIAPAPAGSKVPTNPEESMNQHLSGKAP